MIVLDLVRVNGIKRTASKRGHLMKKRQDGLYERSVTINGKRVHFYGRTQAEINRKITAYKADAESGPLFGPVADEWWIQHEAAVTYNTAKPYRPALARAKEWFGERRIQSIQPHEISRQIKDFSRTYADKTVRTQLMVINLIYKYAVERGYCSENAARDLRVPAGLPKRKVDAPSDDDVQRVKAGLGLPFGLFAYMALYTGLRRGELLALTWEDVDRDKRVIHVNKSLYHVRNRPMVKVPKTAASAADVPILSSLLAVLPQKRHGIVFPNWKGEYITETQFQRLWADYRRDSGVTCTPHQLRHQYATALYENGIPPEQAMVLLRHRQISTTINTYTTIKDRKRQEIFQRVYDIDV